MTKFLSMAAVLTAAAGAMAQPNVLLMIGDDMNVANVSSFNPNSIGGVSAPTPNIDSLGLNGVRFVNTWSAPVCSPTRAALMTGRYGFRTGVRSVGGSLLTSETALAEVLTTAGYETALFGKWHLGTANANGGNDAPRVAGGFGWYAGGLGGGVPDYFSWNKSTNGSGNVTETTYATKDAVDDAIEWINDQDGSWFATVAFNAPHSPFHDPNDSLHSYDLSTGGVTSQYKAMIEAMDTEIGRLLNSMDPNELANTIVMFVGDNGTPGRVREAPYIWGKGSVYEGGVNVPFVVSGPGIVSPDRNYDGLVHVSDIFSTVAELAGVNLATTYPDVTLDGLSLVPVLTSATPGIHRQYNYTESVGNAPVNGNYAVRNYQYKLVYNGSEYEMYDLDADPFETNDLFGDGISFPEQQLFDELLGYLDSLRQDLCTADTNNDAVVDVSDLADVLATFGGSPAANEDINGDGVVDLSDLADVLKEFGQSCW